MIDPFPNQVRFEREYEPSFDFVDVAESMLGSLMAQAIFKLEELKLAQDSKLFSRFVIAPTRRGEGGSGADAESFGLGVRRT